VFCVLRLNQNPATKVQNFYIVKQYVFLRNFKKRIAAKAAIQNQNQ
jgi:hypothetical protein